MLLLANHDIGAPLSISVNRRQLNSFNRTCINFMRGKEEKEQEEQQI